MPVIRKTPFLLLLLCCINTSSGQEIPVNPVSYKLFTPFLFNPAIAGSKDFLSADIIAGFNGKNHSQVLSGNARLARKSPQYTSSSKSYEFTGIGLGGALFSEVNSVGRNGGVLISGSYHKPLSSNALSFISAGIAARGFYHHYNGDEDLDIASADFWFPNIDAGLYYYDPRFYAGISGTNLLGRPANRDTLSTYLIPATRQFFLYAGVKLVVSRALNIVVEPSLIAVTDDSLSFDIRKSIKPALRIYAGDFCTGTYFNDFERISFFFQFRYPRFYVGTFFELPRNTPFYKMPLTAEVALGINLSKTNTGYSIRSHW